MRGTYGGGPLEPVPVVVSFTHPLSGPALSYQRFCAKVNEICPGTFGDPVILDDTPRPNWRTEHHRGARIVHTPATTQVWAETEATIGAFCTAADQLQLTRPPSRRHPRLGDTPHDQ